MNTTKNDIGLYLHQKIGLSKKLCSEIADSFFRVVAQSLSEGKQVRVKNLGKFSPKKKNARIGRNPKTMQEYPISERYVISFSASKNLRKSIN